MGLMSSFNLAVQNALRAWVRGRGLAVYTLVFQLSIAAGKHSASIGLRGSAFRRILKA